MDKITRLTFLIPFFMFFIVLHSSQYAFSASNNSDTVNVIPTIITEFSSFDAGVDIFQPSPADAPADVPADASADAPAEKPADAPAEETDEGAVEEPDEED